MRTRRLVFVTVLLSAAIPAWGADRDAAPVRERLDAAVASVVEGGPAPAADDATYLRRIWIDLAGRIPPTLIARDFLDDKTPDKRARMVDRLLDSEDFADHWGRVLAVSLTSERPIARDAYDGRVLHRFLRESLLKKEPYDRIVRELLVGSGASDASGPANFYLRYEADPLRLAGAVGKNILGVTIQCAQCHDHPFASWKEDDFWGFAATFARVRKMESDDEDNLKAVVEALRGELKRPDPSAPIAPEGKDGEKPKPKQIVIKPRLLNGKSIADANRRASLAEWVVARDNPRFARNLVNRVWGQLFGKSPVPNLDILAAKPESSAVLDILSDDFVQNGYDFRRLLRLLVLSKSYGQASSAQAKPLWARPTIRPMSVDQLYASIAQATGYDGVPDETAEQSGVPDEDDPHADAAPARTAPTAEDDPDDDDDAGEDVPDRAVEAIGERALTLQRALVLLNGDFVREATRSAVRISRATNGRRADASRIEWACLATLSRRPTKKEQAILLALLSEPNGLEDVYWVLINSSEFQADH
ncbi:MAG: hypothetical protein NVSMB14_02340 [Isosphaeraceae bacterium]